MHCFCHDALVPEFTQRNIGITKLKRSIALDEFNYRNPTRCHQVSIIAVRSIDGEIGFYPVTENVHKNGILIYSLCPSPNVSSNVIATMERYARDLLIAMDYVGILAIECFVFGENVLVNELAPRVHNSGHWTELSHATSQFENHLRAITGCKLGTTESLCASGMLNLIGLESPPLHLLSEHSFLHWYNKTPRPGRKVGHVNFRHNSMDKLMLEIKSLADKTAMVTEQKPPANSESW